MKHWLHCVVAALAVSTSMSSAARQLTIDPSDDGSLYTCSDCNLISNGGYVVVSGYIQGAIKFPLASIRGKVVQARLSVNPYGLPMWGLNVDVYGFTSDIGAIDAASANAGTFLGTWTMPPNLGYGSDAFFDVTAFVANATSPYVGFNLRTPSGETDVFSSIEYNYGHPSQLLVTTVPEATPAPVLSPSAATTLVIAMMILAATAGLGDARRAC